LNEAKYAAEVGVLRVQIHVPLLRKHEIFLSKFEFLFDVEILKKVNNFWSASLLEYYKSVSFTTVFLSFTESPLYLIFLCNCICFKK